jgi:hypothetical protein
MRGRLLAFSMALFLGLGGVPAHASSPSSASDQLAGHPSGLLVSDTTRSPAVTHAPSPSWFADGGLWPLGVVLSAGALAAVGTALRRREHLHQQERSD